MPVAAIVPVLLAGAHHTGTIYRGAVTVFGRVGWRNVTTAMTFFVQLENEKQNKKGSPPAVEILKFK